MLYLGILHIILLLSSGLGFLKNSEGLVSPCRVVQYIVFIFALFGKYFDLFPTSNMFNVYMLSAFMVPLFKENFKNEDGFYLYLTLTFLLIALGLNLSTNSVLFGLSALILTLATIKKDLPSVLLSIVSLGTVFTNELGLNSLSSLLSNAMLLGIPFGYYFHNKNTNSLRFLLLPLFFLQASFVTRPFEVVWLLLILLTYLVVTFVNFSASKEEALSFSLLYFLLFKNLEPLDFFAINLLFYGSLEILRMVFIEFYKINFKEGNVEISYQNVIFLILTTYLFSGTIYTPMSILFGNLSGLEGVLFFGIWIIVVLKSIISIKDRKQTTTEKVTNFIIYISPVLLLLVKTNLFTIFNPYPLIGFVLTVSLAILYKKRKDTFKWLNDKVFKLRYYPSLPDVSISQNYSPKIKLDNLKLRGPLVEVRLSFPITVGLLFLFWFLATLSFIEV